MPTQLYIHRAWNYLEHAKRDPKNLTNYVEKAIKIFQLLDERINANKNKNIVFYLPDVDFDLKNEINQLISLLTKIFILRLKGQQKIILDEAIESIEHINYFDQLQIKQDYVKKQSFEYIM